jgi:AraC-like DNA-binding protein
MLKEKTVYKEELPVNVIVADIKNYPIHFHEDIEVVFVLDGSIGLKNGYYQYTLKKGDIYIINDNETHSFESTGEPNMVMMLQMDMRYFSDYYEGLRNSFFITDMEDDNDDSIDVLRTILAKIMMEIIQKGYGYEQKVIESTHNLISCLLSDFRYFVMEDGKFVNGVKNRGDKILAGRLNRITDYMHENYMRKLTLSEIADKEHLSIYYLSHVIKEATGLSFQELLSFIRVEESEKLLLGTNKKIGAIAEESGFSAVRYYIKHFQTWFGMTPSEYRKAYNGKTISHESQAEYERSNPDNIEFAIKKLVKGVYSDYAGKQKSRSTIIDVNLPEAFLNPGEFLFQAELFGREVMKPIARPYNLLKSLKETVLASGPNYIITTASKSEKDIVSMSILIYNVDEQLKDRLAGLTTKDKALELVREYEEETEFLIRMGGLSGDYRVSRYTLTRDNVISAYEDAIRHRSATGTRQAIVNNWSTLPHIDFSRVTVSDTLSLMNTLSGVSAELILLDRE